MKQNQALAILKSGRNVFLTGSAGTGKTYVLNQYIRYLKDRKIKVAVTASTGIAATHMNGMTIHSWSGIGVKDAISQNDLANMRTKRYLTKKLEKAMVLIIDEISMLHKTQVDMVDKVLRHFRESNDAFGGVQVVLSGDFFQLPPVGNANETNRDKFSFMSQAWLDAKLTVCYLSEQYRQSDNALNDILNEIRTGQVSEQTVSELQRAQATVLTTKPTRLYTHNIDVDRLNSDNLRSLTGEKRVFKSITTGNEKLVGTLKKSVLADETLELCVDAEVMFVKNNYDKGYVNGTQGKVIGYSELGLPEVKVTGGDVIVAERDTWSVDDDNGKSLASFSQVPLRLAWAITVHKSQGMTLNAAEIDLTKTFEKGQGYVALSRLKDLDGLQLAGFNEIALAVDPLAAKADKRFQELSTEADAKFEFDTLLKEAKAFVKHCGGITDSNEVKKVAKKRKEKMQQSQKSSYLITLEYVEKGLSIIEIADIRGITGGTITEHILKIMDRHPTVDLSPYRPAASIMKRIETATDQLVADGNKENFQENGTIRLRPLFDAMNKEISYEEIKLALTFAKNHEKQD